MLTEFTIAFSCEKGFANRNMGSLFHGVLMELLPSDYAEQLHQNTLKPFSQHVEVSDTGLKWNICALNAECAKHVNDALMGGIEEIFLRNKEKKLKIISRSMSSISYKTLIDNTYFGQTAKIVKVHFRTPASFKSDGRYLIYPDIAAMYRNLIRKFDAFSDEFSMYDEEILESLINCSAIVSYKLQSCAYSLETVKIPAYIGTVGIKITGSEQLKNLARLLLSFGEYAGIGIKTALGMGAVKVDEVF